MRKKFIYGLVLLAIIAAVVWVGYEIAYPEYQQWKFNRWAENFNKGWEDYFKNDTYGGKTPEETYNLYIAALKRGDTETASKYFYWEYQNEEKQQLDGKKQKGELEVYITGLPKWSELKEEEYGNKESKKYSYMIYEKEKIEKLPDGKGGFIEKKWPAGDYKYYLTFWLNKSANIWKIYSL